MNTRKLAASLTAVVCSMGMLSYLPSFLAPVSAVELVHNDFETNYDGWYANADAVSMTAKAGIGHKDSRGMEVSGRTCASDGVSSEKGLYLSGGETNTYRIWVYSETAEQFHVKKQKPNWLQNKSLLEHGQNCKLPIRHRKTAENFALPLPQTAPMIFISMM